MKDWKDILIETQDIKLKYPFVDMDFKNIDNIEIGGIDFNDAHDFCDAHIVYAEYNGIPMT